MCGKILFWYISQNILYNWSIIFTEIDMYLIREMLQHTCSICMRKNVLTGMWMIRAKLTFVSKRCRQQVLRVSIASRSLSYSSVSFYGFSCANVFFPSARLLFPFRPLRFALNIIYVHAGRNSHGSRADDGKTLALLDICICVRIYIYVYRYLL